MENLRRLRKKLHQYLIGRVQKGFIIGLGIGIGIDCVFLEKIKNRNRFFSFFQTIPSPGFKT